MLILDNRPSREDATTSGARWRLVTDGVMGGMSTGALTPDEIDGRPCLRLRGQVRLDNNGGFVQAALDLGADRALDASAYEGVQIEVYGNGESYNLHLRTRGLSAPWQAYRASFQAGPEWQSLQLPFTDFEPYRTDAPLDTSRLTRLGVVAIGRAFEADLCLGGAALYRIED
ncbi:MAG: CIA30 family protein [Chromatiales bacterium]|jgi:adhesin HecA-like repeat protein